MQPSSLTRRHFLRSVACVLVPSSFFCRGNLVASSSKKDAMAKKEKNCCATKTAPEVLRIRPHHFLDIIRDLGAGIIHEPYLPYGHNVHLVALWLRENHDMILETIIGVDETCLPCKKLVEGRCTDTTVKQGRTISKQDYNDLTDRRYMERLGIEQGYRTTAREFCKLTLERLGDIYSLYPEVEKEKTTLRKKHLMRGLKAYIEG
jgi:hypothetical protein